MVGHVVLEHHPGLDGTIRAGELGLLGVHVLVVGRVSGAGSGSLYTLTPYRGSSASETIDAGARISSRPLSFSSRTGCPC